MIQVGDVVWVELDPVLGNEQAGRRPALVLSSRRYHDVSERAVVCPITSRAQPWPFNVAIPPGQVVKGVILVDQIRTIHRPSRLFGTIGRLSEDVLRQVREVLETLVGVDS